MAGLSLYDRHGGYGAALALDRSLTPQWALEAQLQAAGSAQETQRLAASLGATRRGRFDLAGWSPYLAAGVGLSRLDAAAGTLEGFAANAGGGLLRPLGPHRQLRLDLRYARDLPGGDRHYGGWTLLLGLRFGLDARAPETPLYEPPPVRVVCAGGKDCPIDSDADSVLDRDDRCPNSPPGTAVGLDGCPLDPDGDGVPSRFDDCPNSAPGATVDVRGCVAGAQDDDDGDGIPNGSDHCPDTLESLRVDPAGCALAGQTQRLADLKFDISAAALAPASEATLDAIAAMLVGQPTMQIEIGGHSSALGPEHLNLALSGERAQAIRRALIDRGIDASRLRAEAYGEYRPIADNDSAAGRARNRRVELTVLNP